MRARPILITLTMILAAVVVQTTIFAPGNLQPFGVAPNIVLLVVIAAARYLDAEPAILSGFTAGLLVDLLGGSPLGLWAIALTAVAFAVVKLRDRVSDSPLALAAAVFGFTLMGQVVFVVLGTLFGQGAISDPQVLRKLLLPAVYNVILAAPVFILTRPLFTRRERGWAL